jgi:hypothetical protein
MQFVVQCRVASVSEESLASTFRLPSYQLKRGNRFSETTIAYLLFGNHLISIFPDLAKTQVKLPNVCGEWKFGSMLS